MSSVQPTFFLLNQQLFSNISISHLLINQLDWAVIQLVSLSTSSYDILWGFLSLMSDKNPSKIQILYPFFSLAYISSCLSVAFSLELLKYLVVNKLQILNTFCSAILVSLAKYFVVYTCQYMISKISSSSDDGIDSISLSGTLTPRTTYSGQSSRHKLLNHIYSDEEVIQILSSLGLGYSADAAGSKSADIKAKSITENVRSVELMDPKKMTTSNEKLNDIQIGRNVFEAVVAMISQGGEPLICVVKTNFSMAAYLSQLQQTMHELEESISSTESSYVEPSEPKDDRIKLRHEVELETKEDEIRELWKLRFTQRVDGGVSRSTRSHDGDAIPEAWEDSDEKRQSEQDYEQYKKVMDRKFKREVLELYVKYDEQVEKKAAVFISVGKLRTEMRRQQVLEIFASELVKQCNIIVQKLKTALMAYPYIREKLVQNVLVNGDSIIQPLLTENLSGIYALLYQEYNKITLGAFCNYLMDLMSESSTLDECNQKPQDPLARVDKHLKLWVDMNLQEYMTQDHLFTITLLRTYHPSSNIRRDGVRHVFEFARELELNQNLRRAAGEYANMPLYTELVRWIKDVHVKGMQFSTNTRGFKPSSTPSTSSVTPFSPKTPSLELAATGVEAVDKQGAGTVKPKRGPPPPTGPIATGPYDDEITRDRNLYCSDGFLYIATKKQCENCTHSPRCFNRRCRKCTLYGHRDEQCAQRVRDSSKSTDVTGKH